MNNDPHGKNRNRRRETRGNARIGEACRILTVAPRAAGATEPVAHTLDGRPGSSVSGGGKTKRLAERRDNAPMET
jgi:hypothetical protein